MIDSVYLKWSFWTKDLNPSKLLINWCSSGSWILGWRMVTTIPQTLRCVADPKKTSLQLHHLQTQKVTTSVLQHPKRCVRLACPWRFAVSSAQQYNSHGKRSDLVNSSPGVLCYGKKVFFFFPEMATDAAGVRKWLFTQEDSLEIRNAEVVMFDKSKGWHRKNSKKNGKRM